MGKKRNKIIVYSIIIAGIIYFAVVLSTPNNQYHYLSNVNVLYRTVFLGGKDVPHSYHFKKGSFSIELPNIIRNSYGKNKVDFVELGSTYATSDSHNNAYLIGYSLYSDSVDVSNPINNLESSLSVIISFSSAELISKKLLTVQGFPAIDFMLKMGDEGNIYRGRSVLAGRSLYQMSIIGKNYDAVAAERFINSFVIEIDRVRNH